MKKNLFRQVFPSYVLIVALCLSALGVLSTMVMREFVYSFTEKELIDLIAIVERMYFPTGEEQAPDKALWDKQLEAIFGDRPFRVTIMSPDGQVLADSKARAADLENHASRPEVMAALSRGQGRAVRVSDSVGIELYYLAKPVLRNGATTAVLRVSMPIDILKQELVNLYSRIALGAALILSLAALVAFAVTRKISRPIHQLMGTAERFARGDLGHRSYVAVPDELRILAEAMNSMAAELRKRMDEADTKRKEAETILASMTEGVIVLDPNLKVTQANAAARSIMQVGSEIDPIGRTLLESFRATELKRYAEQALETGEPYEGLLTLWAEGQRNLQVLASALPDRRGCLLVVHDITRLMQLAGFCGQRIPRIADAHNLHQGIRRNPRGRTGHGRSR